VKEEQWKPMKMTFDQHGTATSMTEPIQLALPLARAAPGVGQGTRAIETDFPILEVSRLALVRA